MPLSYVIYQNTTGTGPFNFNIPYISPSHIKVEKNGVLLTLTTHYTLSTSPTTTVTLVSPLVASDVLRIYRQTPGREVGSSSPIVDFTDGSVLTAADLDKNTQQLLYLVQESDDTGSGALAATLDGLNWDAESKQIKSVAAPTANTDAVNKQYVDTLALYGVNQTSGQAWDLVGDGTSQYPLTGPVPSAADPELFIVEVGGALQHPGTNYSITQSGGNYFLQLTENVSSPTKIRVRNLGVSRGTISGSTVTVDGSTLAVDMANNRVGIGTTTPQSDLNVHGSTSISRIQLTNTTTGNATATTGFGVVTNGDTSYLYNYANGPLIFGTNYADRGRIDASGNVIIGGTTPAAGYKLDVNGSLTVGAGTDIAPNASGDGQLRLEGNGYNGYAALDGNGLHIGHTSAARVITFDINEAEKVRITLDGNIAVGRADSDVPITIKNNVAANTTTSDNVANQLRLYDAANAVYGFGISSGSLNISANQGGTGEISFWTGGTDSTAPSQRLVIPAGSAGIRFPATAAISTDANTLDDYREGTWTPTFSYFSRAVVGGSPENFFRAIPNVTYTSGVVGLYTKIGSLVYINFFIGTSSLTAVAGAAATWYLAVTSLPFPPASAIDGAHIGWNSGWTTSAPTHGFSFGAQPTTGTSQVANGGIYLMTAAGTGIMSHISTLNLSTSAGNGLYGSMTYRTGV